MELEEYELKEFVQEYVEKNASIIGVKITEEMLEELGDYLDYNEDPDTDDLSTKGEYWSTGVPDFNGYAEYISFTSCMTIDSNSALDIKGIVCVVVSETYDKYEGDYTTEIDDVDMYQFSWETRTD